MGNAPLYDCFLSSPVALPCWVSWSGLSLPRQGSECHNAKDVARRIPSRTMEIESYPRLSSRLLLSLHGVHSMSPIELKAVRKAELDKENKKSDSEKSRFSIDRFLPNIHSYGPEDVRQIQTHFKKYLELIGALAKSESLLPQNSANTIYNIISRQPREKAHRDVQSLFGFVEKDLFQQMCIHVNALNEFSTRVHRREEHHDHEFGFDFEFEVPTCAMDSDLFVVDASRSFSNSSKITSAAGCDEPVGRGEELDLQWFEDSVGTYVQSLGPHSAWTGSELCQQIASICRESKSSADLEAPLFELLGENFDLLMMIVQNAEKISLFDDYLLEKERNKNKSVSTNFPVSGSKLDSISSSSSAFDSLSANQKKKVLLREQKELDLALQATAEDDNTENFDWLQKLGFTDDYLNEERALGLQKNRNFERWTEGLAPEGTREYYEKRGLPAGAKMQFKTLDLASNITTDGPVGAVSASATRGAAGYVEVFLPAAKKPAQLSDDQLVRIDSLDSWARPAFPNTVHLNRIQSAVYPCAYFSSENMLVCAPTGAGKTNVAMLTLLQLVRQHIDSDGNIDPTNLKAIYIAPMKALAQEVVSKFSERLAPLGLTVKEYTGDMQLTRQELAEANLLVCTPEKYDVSTRKGGDGSLGTLVSLIIIDEVHLLADERGAVIETIVARTQRYVESSQKLVRIVGLSATLPNYVDVASFLRVNKATGLFYFGPEYRPIPLDQSFLAVTEKQRVKQNMMMTRLAYDKMVAGLQAGKQVMIFVHSRKDTSKTIEAILELCAKFGGFEYLQNAHHEKFTLWKKEVEKSRSIEVQNLFDKGVGVHHAGMLRSDRSLTERLFEFGLIKVLCCTATLAWGVNLPAHTVIVKGTELYDPERGGYVDLSILDILQIFGRAGRPQFDTSGHAILITPHKSLAMYLGMLAQQAPIESALIKALADHLNAEIVNGTVNNVKEAVAWLSYTFLFVRMKQNPWVYGINYEDLYADPQLEQKRLQLIREAADTLDTCMMTRFDKRSGNLAVTDLGRIASHYYIKHTTVQGFNNMLAPHLSDPDAVHVLCSSAEFDQLKVRPEELAEIDQLKKNSFLKIRASTDDTAGKVSVLLQSYLSFARVSSFTLQSDTNYVAQNAGRIARALFEICLKRGWSTMSRYYLCLCKSIDRRVRMDLSPLRQFSDIPVDLVKKLEEAEADYDILVQMGIKEIGQLIHNQKQAPRIKECVHRLPMLGVEAKVQPITRGIIRMTITLTATFEWIDRYHGLAEPFWIWIEDGENEFVYHSEYFILQKKQRHDVKVFDVTIPVQDPLPPQYYVRVMSDVWVGCESVTTVSFRNVLMPVLRSGGHTNLLDLHPLPKTALRNALFESMYSFSHFNPIQTQTFHVLYNTDRNVLVGAPTGSGKTITAELAILRLLQAHPGQKTIYVAPLKALARERLSDWQQKLGGKLGLRILELSGEITPDIEDLRRADILIVTPEKWDGISRGWQNRDYVKKVGLVVIDEIHLLGVDRGPVLEVIVSRMRFIAAQTGVNVRFVGLSTALANARDLGDWLGIEEGTPKGAVGLYNFCPSVRPVPMSIHIQGFPGKHYCPRMATMNKPAYAAILEHSPTKPVLIFVSSRRQTRLTALDLIAYCAADDDPRRFLHMDEDSMVSITSTIQDKALKDTLAFGVGIHHAGLDNHDRNTVEELFLNNKIQVLVCTSTLAWGVNLPCHLVIVKGTEYFDGKSKGYVDFPVTDILQMMGRAGRPQFDDSAVACIFVHEPKKNFYRKFLHEPFPVESSLHTQLHEHINAEIANGTIHNLPDCVEYLTWTYFFRRVIANPSYYQLQDSSANGIQTYLTTMIRNVISALEKASCVRQSPGLDYSEHFETTALGRITSFYYLRYTTANSFAEQFRQLRSHLESATSKSEDVNVPAEVLMKIMCDAAEFSELPVRHNEELLNGELAVQLGFAGDSPLLGSMESPHTKAFLLLHAFLRKAKLPIADYINDTKTVFDQIPRVLNAMIDVAAEEGIVCIVKSLYRLTQLIAQGVPDSSIAEFLQLRFPAAVARDLLKHGQSMRSLGGLTTKQKRQTLRRAFQSADIPVDEEWIGAVEQLPTLQSSSHRIGWDRQPSAADLEHVGKQWLELHPSESCCMAPLSSCEYQFTLQSSGSIYKAKGAKKPATWIALLVLTDVGQGAASLTGRVLSMKRLGSVRDTKKISMAFTMPADLRSGDVRLILLNDSFLGVDSDQLVGKVILTTEEKQI